MARRRTRRDDASLRSRVTMMAFLVGGMWVVEIVDHLAFSQGLDVHGIRPHDRAGLWGILFAPFLHAGFQHLMANTVPLLVLSWFALLRGVGQFLEVTVLVMLFGGLGTWMIGAENSVHIGASILVFGYFGYLLLRGVFERSLGAIVVALLVGGLYGGLLWGVLPSRPEVSWEGHLCGFVGGAVSAWLGVRFQRK